MTEYSTSQDEHPAEQDSGEIPAGEPGDEEEDEEYQGGIGLGDVVMHGVGIFAPWNYGCGPVARGDRIR